MNDTVKALIDRIPELDAPPPPQEGQKADKSKGMPGKFTGPRRGELHALLDDLLAGGPGSIRDVIGSLQEIDDGSDYKSRYALHTLANYVNDPGKTRQREILNQVLVAALKEDLPKPVKGFLIRQLQWSGTAMEAGDLGAWLPDADLHEYAAQALLAIRTGAFDQFRRALRNAEGAARITAIRALGELKDRGSLGVIEEAAISPDETLRLTAHWALASIGDPRSVETLIAGDTLTGGGRTGTAKACLLMAENLAAAGRRPESDKLYRHLTLTRTEPAEAYLKELAKAALSDR